MARIIPKNTKVRMTFYKGVTIPDIIIGFIGLVLVAIAFSSNLAFRALIGGGIFVAFVPLYITINGDRLYLVIAYFFKHLVSKKKYGKTKGEIEDVIPYQNVNADGIIELKDSRFAGVVEVSPVDFRMLDDFTQKGMMDAGLGRVLNSVAVGQEVDLVKIERPLILDNFMKDEMQRVIDVIDSSERRELTKLEYEARVDVIQDRMLTIEALNTDNNGEIIFDFNKVIPVEDTENEQECLEKWGTIRNSSSTQFHTVGEENPNNLSDKLYFNSHDKVPKIIQRLSELHPDWEIEYEYAGEWAETAGRYEYREGKETDNITHDYRSDEAIDTFSEVWGRRDNFEWCSKLFRYVGTDEKASIRLLPRVEKDYFDYYKREVMGASKNIIFANSYKNSFVYGLKNYLLGMPENEELAEGLLKTKGNLFDSLYTYKMSLVGTSKEQDEMRDFCDDWFGTYQQLKAEMEM